eukprot:4115307-Amphidinium_carterae.1
MFEPKLSDFSLGRESYDALLQQRLQFHHPSPQNLPHSVALLKALVQVGGDHTKLEHAWLAELCERGTYIAAPSLDVPRCRKSGIVLETTPWGVYVLTVQ